MTDEAATPDSAAVSEVLAEYCRSASYDVVLCGKQSQDTDAGLTGGMLASRLGLPYATNAVGLELREGGLRVTRQGDAGQEILHLPAPCLVTCSNDMNDPRIPSLKGIMQAKRKEIQTLQAELGESATRILGAETPAEREPVSMLEGDPAEVAEALVQALDDATDLIRS